VSRYIFRHRQSLRWLPAFLGLLLVTAQTIAPAQSAAPPVVAQTVQLSHSTPLPITPEPSREQQLREALQQLTTTGRIMQVVAHPDDEDGGLLTLEARVDGETTMLFTLTRGEGGQNAEGAVFFDELGILRTEELLAADRIYGADERFSHVADFGFSKTPQETFAKWGGKDVPLADLVRLIRIFQPDVLVARFGGTPRDGHGHHQASALLTREAFTAAADPHSFYGPKYPDQFELPPWQPAKLYIGNVGDAATLRLDLNQPSPLLGGKTPAEIAWEGLRHQLSQGAGNWHFNPAREYANYQLAATAPGFNAPSHETSMFAGIDTSLPGLADRFPQEAAGLKQPLAQVAALIAQAQVAFDAAGPDAAVAPLAQALHAIQSPPLYASSAQRSTPFQIRLFEKREQLEQALLLAERLTATLTLAAPNTANPFVIPGEKIGLDLTLSNKGKETVTIHDPLPGLPTSIGPNETIHAHISRTIAKDAAPTRPYFHRDSPVHDAVYQTTDEMAAFGGLALPNAPITATISFNIAGATAGLTAEARIPTSRVFIAPPVSIRVQPSDFLLRRDAVHSADVRVEVRNNSQSPQQGSVSLTLPTDWTSTPAHTSLTLAPGASQTVPFTVQWPSATPQSQSHVTAGFHSSGEIYSDGYELVARADLDPFPYYAPARTSISLVDASLPANINIGYIMGVGDTIPQSLNSLGFHVTLLTAQDLASANLAPYGAIVTGIRAYATRADLRDHNSRLLEYVKNGGTLIVQYEQDTEGFNRGHFTPYPAVLGNQRVSQEEQPVTLLEPNADLFRYPNRITESDFNGWVQERGLYFMKEWSPEYQPLLSCHDAGEPPQLGGLVEASYGKGVYIYTALAFFRQLPNGVPGATRLFVNLLGAGHDPATQPVVSAHNKTSPPLSGSPQR
jgi:LmbE family N-acetylglucosaminyl deacetylase